jgi:hypothetical protein
MSLAARVGRCLSEDEVQDHLEGRLDDGARGQLLAHLDTCEACRGVVAQTARAMSIPAASTRSDARPVGGRFVLRRPVGAGGMGVVYEALDRSSGDRVALKMLHGVGDRERFLREARLLAELHHPGIVRYVAHGVDEPDAPWLAMEWLDGENLSDRLARQPLEAAESLDVVRLTAEALGAAHARGVTHRDVKPSNLFLVDRRVDGLRLLDFGVARARPGTFTDQLTRTGVVIGTIGYMAPEQARGARDVDPRADVFALGCVLYRCLSGQAAFSGESVAAILAKILYEEPAPLDELLPDAPRELVELVSRMLDKDPARRPADGDDVAARLARLGAVPALAPPTRPAPHAAITTGEQRLISVVMGREEHSLAVADTILDGPASGEDATVASTHAPAFARGGEMAVLADGSWVCLFAQGPSGYEQALAASRFALAIASSRRMAVAVAEVASRGGCPSERRSTARRRS